MRLLAEISHRFNRQWALLHYGMCAPIVNGKRCLTNL